MLLERPVPVAGFVQHQIDESDRSLGVYTMDLRQRNQGLGSSLHV